MASVRTMLCLLAVQIYLTSGTIRFRSSMQLNVAMTDQEQEMNMKSVAMEAISDMKFAANLLQEAFAGSENVTRNSSKVQLTNTSQTIKAQSPLNHSKVLSHSSKKRLQQEAEDLQKLFAHLKTNIAKINKNEDYSKSHVKDVVESLQKRYQQDKNKLKSANLSSFEHERLVNRTRTEEAELKYWSRSRELQHGMFHANLKLSHGLMSRVKQVLDAYKDVLAKGKIDSKVAQVMNKVTASLPKAFVQVTDWLAQ